MKHLIAKHQVLFLLPIMFSLFLLLFGCSSATSSSASPYWPNALLSNGNLSITGPTSSLGQDRTISGSTAQQIQSALGSDLSRAGFTQNTTLSLGNGETTSWDNPTSKLNVSIRTTGGKPISSGSKKASKAPGVTPITLTVVVTKK